ncbi:aldose 1-epimerase family protein [Salegentibacter salegens]|uniref:Galactose mutarotase n=1 Tax=Salegentibacter salegens TaxID=143223 RepID=A0A1M7NXC6_9FLAO|nr:aldose 1-epimerase family protein [Salegentibacter salegens]PRX46419.1 galactose mutarotase-like enzyme [Salegentibacter salegens]SHN08800.1 Galactose mutarotase [Salegentibacter salegens]
MHELQNEFLSIKVNPIGAELSSLKNLETGIEHLWQGNPEFWASQAPNLFPVIGVLKEGKFIFEDKEYKMPKHGFVRHNENIQLKEKTENKLVFQLAYSKETLAIFPFKFRFEISFQLNKKSLTVHHKISNLDDKPLYFSLGGHPAFNAPISENEVYEDYYLEFDRKMDLRTHVLCENGLVSDKTVGILDNEDKIRLHKELFAKDALILKKIPSKKIALKSKNLGTVLSVEYKDFKNLGIWAKPGAPYVCIEPWLGIADVEGTDQNLKTKEGIETLEAQKTFEASYTIHIN